jgi:hypothetical protein
MEEGDAIGVYGNGSSNVSLTLTSVQELRLAFSKDPDRRSLELTIHIVHLQETLTQMYAVFWILPGAERK